MATTFIPDKAAGAYTVLWKHHPYYASGLMKPPMIILIVKDYEHKAAVQNLTIRFNEEFIDSITWNHAAFVLAHEIMHYMLRHHELVWGWIIAGEVTGYINGVKFTFPYHELTCQHSLDMVINDGLRTNAQMEVPDDAIINPMVGDWRLAEADVYVREYQKKLDAQQQKQDEKGKPNSGQGNTAPPDPNAKPSAGKGRGEPGADQPGAPDINNAQHHMQKGPCEGNTKGLYLTAELVGKGEWGVVLPVDPNGVDQVKQNEIIRQWVEELTNEGIGKMAGMVERLTEGVEKQPEDWRKLIRPRVITAIGRDVDTWTKLNMRGMMVRSIRPGQQGRRANDVCLFIDSSGSINAYMQRIFVGGFADMYEQVTPRTTHLCVIDTRVRDHVMFKTVPQMRRWVAEHKDGSKGLAGGGGTDMRRAYDWLEEQKLHPSLAVFFTDGYTPFPESLGPCKRVIWVMTTGVVAPREAGETIRFTMPRN